MFGRYKIAAALVVLAMVIVLAACRGSSKVETPPGGSSAPSLEGSEWLLVSLNGQELVQGTNITLAFAEGKASGSAGCNRYGGSYTATNQGGFAMSEIAITEMYCVGPDGVMDQETAYTKALMSAAAYREVDDRLEIDDAAGQTVLIFEASE